MHVLKEKWMMKEAAVFATDWQASLDLLSEMDQIGDVINGNLYHVGYFQCFTIARAMHWIRFSELNYQPISPDARDDKHARGSNYRITDRGVELIWAGMVAHECNLD